MDEVFIIDSDWRESYDVDAYIARRVIRENAAKRCDTYQGSDSPINANIHNIIPVGNVDYIESWLERYHGEEKHIPPIEVPECLRHFCERYYQILLGSDIPANMKKGKFFLKDASFLKSWNNVLYAGMDERDMSEFIHPDHKYVVSERVDFLSEWRVFVLDDEIVGCQWYLGDPCLFPSRDTLLRMVNTYKVDKSRPGAYSLDVGVVAQYSKTNDTGIIHTEPIEIHPMVACGLYGYYDENLLDMWQKGWQWCVNATQA